MQEACDFVLHDEATIGVNGFAAVGFCDFPVSFH